MDRPPLHICAAALCAAALLVPAAARAENGPFFGRAMVAPTVGQSVLVETEVDRAALRYELELGAHAGGFRAAAAIGLTHFTSDRGEFVRQVAVGDLWIGSSYDALDIAPVVLRPRLDAVLPASKYSRDITLLFAGHLGLDAVATLGPLTMTGLVRLRRDVHREPNPLDWLTARADTPKSLPGPYGFRTAGSRLPGREEPSLALGSFVAPDGTMVPVVGAPNTAWATHLGVQFVGDIAGGWFADLGFGWTHTWSHQVDTQRNVFTSTRPDRLQRNIHTATLGGGVVRPVGPVELEARLGITSSGRAGTVADQQPRFPFWNFDEPERDESVLDLRLTARY